MSPTDRAAWAKKRRAEAGTPDGEPLTIQVGPGHQAVLHANDFMAMNAQNRTIEAWLDDGVEAAVHEASIKVSEDFQKAIESDPRKAGWESYIGVGSVDINANMRKGVSDDRGTQMLSLLDSHGVEAPARLFRGEYDMGTPPTLPSIDYKVGETYADKAFNSWSGETSAARAFGSVLEPWRGGYATASVVFVLKTNGQKALIGNPYESESIIPPHTGYLVTGVTEHVGEGRVRRVIEMEVAQ